MSSVLIGLVAVILFIGLAIAGLVVFGDGFSRMSHGSIASALMTQLKQAADAADLRRLKTGALTTPSTETSFLVPRFLKEPASSPVPRARARPGDPRWTIAFNNNLEADGFYEPFFNAKYVVATIGPINDAAARGICQSITNSYGLSDIPDIRANTERINVGPAGCVLTVSSTTFTTIPQYLAYVRIASASQNLRMPS